MNRITYTIENRGFLRYFSGNIQDDEWLNSTKLLKLPGEWPVVQLPLVLQLVLPRAATSSASNS